MICRMWSTVVGRACDIGLVMIGRSMSTRHQGKHSDKQKTYCRKKAHDEGI
jgi:hypothetical protein